MRKVFEVDGIEYWRPSFFDGSVFLRPFFEFINPEDSSDDDMATGVIASDLRWEGPFQTAADKYMRGWRLRD